jgi:hypothetical protein
MIFENHVLKVSFGMAKLFLGFHHTYEIGHQLVISSSFVGMQVIGHLAIHALQNPPPLSNTTINDVLPIPAILTISFKF